MIRSQTNFDKLDLKNRPAKSLSDLNLSELKKKELFDSLKSLKTRAKRKYFTRSLSKHFLKEKKIFSKKIRILKKIVSWIFVLLCLVIYLLVLNYNQKK